MRLTMKYSNILALTAILISLIVVERAQADPASWKLMAVTGQPASCMHVVKQSPGQQIVFCGSKLGQISRSTNSGKTFIDMSIDVKGKKPVTDIFFSSIDTGWSASHDFVYRSTDSGFTWRALPIPTIAGLSWTSVYYNRGNRTLLVSSKNGGLLTSTDEGATFRYTPTEPLGGFAFGSEISGIIAGYNGHALYTSDGGVSWNTSEKISSWRPCVVGDQYFAADPFTQLINRSTDGGATWQQIASFVGIDSLVGQIMGNCEQLIVNTLNQGYFRSIDQGKHWIRIQGPHQDYETTADLAAAYLIAHFDMNKLKAFAYPIDTLGFGSIYLEKSLVVIDASCNKLSDSVKVYGSFFCGNGVELVAVEYVGPSSIVVSYPALPQVVRDSLIIGIKYNMAGPGEVEGVVRLRFLDNGVLRDSSILIFARSSGATINLIYEKGAITGSDPCALLIKEITLVSGYCDTAFVESAKLRHAERFALDNLFVSYLLSGESLKLSIRVSMDFNGRAYDTLDVRIKTPVSYIDTAIALEAVQTHIEKPFVTAVKTDFGRVSQCENKTEPLWIENPSCISIRVDSVVVADASGSYSVLTRRFPILLAPGQKDSVHIELAPKIAGSLQRLANVYASNDKYATATQATIAGIGVSAVATAATIDHAVLDLGEISTCSAFDTSLKIRHNGGCDSLSIDVISFNGDKSLTATVTDWKPTLGTNDIVTVRVSLKPLQVGVCSGVIKVRSKSQKAGDWIEQLIPVTGKVVLDQSPVIVSAPTFRTISLCGRDSSAITVTNPGCAPRRIDANVSGAFSADMPSITLEPGATGQIKVYFDPIVAGPVNGGAELTITDLSFDMKLADQYVQWTAEATGGSKVLELANTSIDFGETTICDEREAMINLVNGGCDTVTITSADIDTHYILDAALPIVIKPGERIQLRIVTALDTTGHPTNLSGFLRLSSDADKQLERISLSRKIIYPARLLVETLDNTRGSAGELAKFRIVLEGDVPSSVTALAFDLVHNNDLLEFKSFVGDGITIASTTGVTDQHQRFVLSPVHAGVLSELTFQAFMTDTSTTTLGFENISVSTSVGDLSPDCIAKVADSSSNFNYVYVCGDKKLQEMLGMRTIVKSISPSPAEDHIVVALADGVGEATITIIDVLGNEVIRSSSHDRIDVRDLAEGVYYVRVVASGVTQTWHIIIQR